MNTDIYKKTSPPKIDPSFKSKRYRDKLRTEIKALENLLPIDKTALHRKLDSQTIFRLVLAYLRTDLVFKEDTFQCEADNADVGVCYDDKLVKQCLEINFRNALDGFLVMLTTDGTILYVTENVQDYLGFSQTDLLHRCLYGIVHPCDRHELKNALEQTCDEYPRSISTMCRIRCYNGSNTGHVKMHCSGKIRFSSKMKSSKTSPYVAFVFCQSFRATCTENNSKIKRDVFWSRHDMDLNFQEIDKKVQEILGHESDDIAGKSFYTFIHPDDLAACASCHKNLLETSCVHTIHFRMQTVNGGWCWLYSRGKVISKHSKKCSIVFSHCPVSEQDDIFVQEEYSNRQKHTFQEQLAINQQRTCKQLLDLPIYIKEEKTSSPITCQSQQPQDYCFITHLQDVCPSSWHAIADRHSPILPSSHMTHKVAHRDKNSQYQDFYRKQKQCERTNSKQELKIYPGKYCDVNRNNLSDSHLGNIQPQPSQTHVCYTNKDGPFTSICSGRKDQYSLGFNDPLYSDRPYSQLKDIPSANNIPYFMAPLVPNVQFSHSTPPNICESNVQAYGNSSNLWWNSLQNPNHPSSWWANYSNQAPAYNLQLRPMCRPAFGANNQSFFPPHGSHTHNTYCNSGTKDTFYQHKSNEVCSTSDGCYSEGGNVYHYDIEASVHMKIVDHQHCGSVYRTFSS